MMSKLDIIMSILSFCLLVIVFVVALDGLMFG